jgi:hypothetical protein
MTCGSNTASTTRNPWRDLIWSGNPGTPTSPSHDYYSKDACDLKVANDGCVDNCVIDKLVSKVRPRYAIGPAGIDCQQFSRDLIDSCIEQCQKKGDS